MLYSICYLQHEINNMEHACKLKLYQSFLIQYIFMEKMASLFSFFFNRDMQHGRMRPCEVGHAGYLESQPLLPCTFFSRWRFSLSPSHMGSNACPITIARSIFLVVALNGRLIKGAAWSKAIP
jgi:hypothetical protein